MKILGLLQRYIVTALTIGPWFQHLLEIIEVVANVHNDGFVDLTLGFQDSIGQMMKKKGFYLE